MKYKNNDEYDGDWLEGKKHGNGTQSSGKGDKYIGEFLNDKI